MMLYLTTSKPQGVSFTLRMKSILLTEAQKALDDLAPGHLMTSFPTSAPLILCPSCASLLSVFHLNTA